MKLQYLTAVSCFAIGLAGCAKPAKISGEVFTKNGDKVVRQSGILVFFLSEKQHVSLEQKLELWRQFELKDTVESQLKAADEAKSIANVQENFEQIAALRRQIERDKEKMEEKYWNDRLFPLNRDELNMVLNTTVEEFRKALSSSTPPKGIGSTVPESHYCVTNSEGRFETELVKGEPVWVYCVSENQTVTGLGYREFWYFHYVPDGTQLILSSANAHFQWN